MNQLYLFLSELPLFQKISPENIQALLLCMNAFEKNFKPNETIFEQGQSPNQFGIVLSGAVQLVTHDFSGNRNVLAQIKKGELFGESFGLANTQALPFSVLATIDSRVLLLDCNRITCCCEKHCAWHEQMIQNLLRICAQKNLVQNKKIQILSCRTTTQKLMSYLLSETIAHDSFTFEIPFDRQQLADYLCVERSAMSAVIGRLCKEKAIETQGKHFKILKQNLL